MDDRKAALSLGMLLGSPGQELSELILNCCDSAALRRFASACAAYALEHHKIVDPVLIQALQAASAAPLDGGRVNFPQLHEDVQQAVTSLDQVAFELQEAFRGGSGSGEAYDLAHQRARAAESVLACLSASATYAAAEACYQAYCATNRADRLLVIGQSILQL